MKNLSRLVLLTLIVFIVGGGFFLTTWKIPAPKTTIEKVLPNDRFPS